jgi:competence protein ComEA
MTFAESETPSALGRAHAESTQVSSSSFEGGGRDAAPASEPRRLARFARLRDSVWAPVALKFLGVGLGMLALSGIGAWSILSPARGVDLSRAESSLQKDILGAWLAGSQAPPAAPGAQRAAPSPAHSAEPEPLRDAGSDAAPKGGSGLTADGKVILNLASVDELTRLPGVGTKRAQRIVELRDKLGRFKKLTDLLRVKGIGAKGLRRMLPHLVLDPPAPS